jgi:hypothetical protein
MKYIYVITEDLKERTFIGFSKEADVKAYCKKHNKRYFKAELN